MLPLTAVDSDGFTDGHSMPSMIPRSAVKSMGLLKRQLTPVNPVGRADSPGDVSTIIGRLG